MNADFDPARSGSQAMTRDLRNTDMHGSCLCGAIHYEIDGLSGPINHCSCRTCRKAHAAAFTSTAAVDRTHFRWLVGERQKAR